MPDNTLSTLEQIRTKIRRITRSPSTAQLANATINDYINTFVLYDFPEHLRTFTLRTTLTFYTEPFIDTYSGDDIVTNFDNLYTNVYGTAYVAGYKQLFSQNRDAFFALYPKTESIRSIGTDGDGATVNFTGTLSGIPMLRNHVSFTSIDANNVGLEVHDVPNDPNDGAGTFAGDTGAAGSINYTTGVYDITFDTAPGNGETINSQTVPYSASRPKAILYHNNELTFRPVPDQPYRVELEVQARPTEMLTDATMPELSQWWQYIAYGAAKKIFEDRMDIESVQLIMPEFKKQETLVNRRTIDQQSKERSATIYTEMSAGLADFFNNSGRG
jgi:hypothetical protein